MPNFFMKDYKSNSAVGLSESNTTFIVVLVFIALMLFGPVEPYGNLIRICYLIFIPSILWVILHFWGSKWNLDDLHNARINRTLYAIVAASLLVGAYFDFTRSYHLECDQYARTYDGQECVGDYIVVQGADIGGAMIQILFACFAGWLAFFSKTNSPEN